MLRRNFLVQSQSLAHIFGSFQGRADDVEGQAIDSSLLAVRRRIQYLLVGHFPAQHLRPKFFIATFDTEPDGVTTGLGGGLAKFLVHYLDPGVDGKWQVNLLLVDFEKCPHELQIRQEQFIPKFKIANIV